MANKRQPLCGLPLFLDWRKSNVCKLFPSLLHGMPGQNVYADDAWQNVASGGLILRKNIVCDPDELHDAFVNPFYEQA